MIDQAKAQLIGRMSGHLVQIQVKLVKAEAQVRELEILNRDLAKAAGKIDKGMELSIRWLSMLCLN